MNRKTAIALLVAVACGLGAMFASSRMLSGNSAPAAPEMQEVLVAARDLNSEEVLKPDMVKPASIPKDTVPAGSFASFKDLEERWVQIKLLEGEAVVDKKLAPKGTPPGLVAKISRGKRAFAINVNEQTGVSGFILPEHHVDVIQVKPPPPETPNAEPTADTVLEDLLVLASGTTIQSTADRSIVAKTVTLEVTADEASILTAAQSKGPLSLALRGVNDRGRAAFASRLRALLPKIRLAMPAKAEPPPAPKPEPPPPAAKPEPPPEAVAVEAPPRYVTIHRGVNNRQQVRVDLPSGAEADDGFPPASDPLKGGAPR